MKRTALARYMPLKSASSVRRTALGARPAPLTRSGYLNPRSTRRRQQEREYGRLRRSFLDAHPRCAFPRGCGALADTVQHLRGRRGGRLNDTTYWAPSCLAHNLWAEDHTGEALEIGWLIRVEGAS